MNHFTALLLKLVTAVIAYAIALDLFFDATWVDVITFSLLVTILSYLIGDMILLPIIGNTKALIADFLLSYMVVWIFGSVLLNNYIQIGWGSIISAILITVSEIFIHRIFLTNANQLSLKQQKFTADQLAYHMETSQEFDPRKNDKW